MGSILLVEADPDTRVNLESALGAAGHEVLVAFSMRDAILRLSEGGIDVVVIDSYDPNAGVVELARSIDALPDTPPVVLVSGSPDAPEISARIGVAVFVPKPYEPGELVGAVAKLLLTPRPVQVFDDEEPTGPARQTG